MVAAVSVFDTMPWGYCKHCRLLVAVDDDGLKQRHPMGAMGGRRRVCAVNEKPDPQPAYHADMLRADAATAAYIAHANDPDRKAEYF